MQQSDSIRTCEQGLSGIDSGEKTLKPQCLPSVWLASGLFNAKSGSAHVGTSRHTFFDASNKKMIFARPASQNPICFNRDDAAPHFA
jgi:hypothetical protein